jgi:hypothetical protein
MQLNIVCKIMRDVNIETVLTGITPLMSSIFQVSAVLILFGPYGKINKNSLVYTSCCDTLYRYIVKEQSTRSLV